MLEIGRIRDQQRGACRAPQRPEGVGSASLVVVAELACDRRAAPGGEERDDRREHVVMRLGLASAGCRREGADWPAEARGEERLTALLIAKNVEHAWAGCRCGGGECRFDPGSELLLFVELLERPSSSEVSVNVSSDVGLVALEVQPRGHDEALSCQRPGSTKRVGAFGRILDHVDDVAEVDDVGWSA